MILQCNIEYVRWILFWCTISFLDLYITCLFRSLKLSYLGCCYFQDTHNQFLSFAKKMDYAAQKCIELGVRALVMPSSHISGPIQSMCLHRPIKWHLCNLLFHFAWTQSRLIQFEPVINVRLREIKTNVKTFKIKVKDAFIFYFLCKCKLWGCSYCLVQTNNYTWVLRTQGPIFELHI